MRCGLDQCSDRRLERSQFGGHLLQQPSLHPLYDVGRGMLATVSQAGLQIEQVLTRIDDLGQLLAYRITGLAWRVGEGLGKPGDHLRVDGIVLGQSPRRASEVAHPLRIDDPTAVERMGAHQAPVASFDRRSPAVSAYSDLWDEVLARLASDKARSRAQA